METSYVYILILKDRPMFKIGKANDIINRYNLLKTAWGDFELDKSISVKCSKDRVLKLEGILKYLFKDYQYVAEEKYDGYTELYKIECFEDIKNFLTNHKNHPDILEIKHGIEQPKPKPKSNWHSLTKEEKKIRIEKGKELKRKKLTEHNINTVNGFIEKLQNLQDKIIYCNINLSLLVLETTNINIDFETTDEFDELFNQKALYILHGGTNFLSSMTKNKNFCLIRLNLSSPLVEEIDNHQELKQAYKILKNYFERLMSLSHIQINPSIGEIYLKELNEVSENIISSLNEDFI